MFKPILITVLVVAVIATECVLAWMLIPSTGQVQAWADQQAAAPATQAAAGDKQDGKTSANAQDATAAKKSATGDADKPTAAAAEIDLGKFGIVVHKPASDLTLRVNFHLVGIVATEKSDEFKGFVEKAQHRLRDLVIFEVRNAEPADLTDPGLGLIKRRILAEMNELVGKPLLESIVFSDYTFREA